VVASLVRSFVLSPHRVARTAPLRRAVRAVGLARPLTALHRRALRWMMARRYGPEFRSRRIGRLTVQGLTFPFRDPALAYLERAFFGDAYEPAVTRLLQGLLAEGEPVFVDVGAYLGFFTVYAGRLNPRCRVHAFEPNAEYRAVLQDNVRINGLDAELWPVALSDECGESAFGDRSFRVEPDSCASTVETATFDRLREAHGLRPDVMKIDVHGCEGKVLSGMRTTLREDVRHLFCEVHPQELLVDCDVKQILDLLIASGLQVHEMDRFRDDPDPVLVPLEARYDDLVRPERWTDAQRRNRRMLYATKPA
jgi:FkbM family methyltransferase